MDQIFRFSRDGVSLAVGSFDGEITPRAQSKTTATATKFQCLAGLLHRQSFYGTGTVCEQPLLFILY